MLFRSHYADRQIEKKNWKGIAVGQWTASVVVFFSKFIPIMIGYLVGAPVIKIIVQAIPTVIKDGLAQSGNLLPALGIAMLMQLTYDKKYAPFLFLGFALVAFLKVPMIGVAVFGLIIAYIYYQFKPNDQSEEDLL